MGGQIRAVLATLNIILFIEIPILESIRQHNFQAASV